MNNDYYNKIAELLLMGVNFRRGDKLMLSVEHDQRDAGLAVLNKAYEQGADFVELQYSDDYIARAAVAHGTREPWFPDYIATVNKEIASPGWKLLSIRSNAFADAYEGLDETKFSTYMAARSKAFLDRRKAIMSNAIPWSLTYLPSGPMAQKAFPGLDESEAVAAYWRQVIAIMGLDHDDPVAFWKQRLVEHTRQSNFMTGLDTDYLHFTGPGTDLKVGIPADTRWIGGPDVSKDQQQFVANIPTDEIFTTPDWRRTAGRVALTKPFAMHANLGTPPEDAWFVFRDGKVVEYGAKSGMESLDGLFAIDERNRYLGEVALVDPQAAIAKSGITFYNGLYDENAACHLALGAAYTFPHTLQGEFSTTEMLERGYNDAKSHEDMMVGSDRVEVRAVLKDGSSVDLIVAGKVVF